MHDKILDNLDKRKFVSPEILSLVLFRVLKIVLFCLSLTLLFWLFLLKSYIIFTLLLGVVLGSVSEILTNSRRGFLKDRFEEGKGSLSEENVDE